MYSELSHRLGELTRLALIEHKLGDLGDLHLQLAIVVDDRLRFQERLHSRFLGPKNHQEACQGRCVQRREPAGSGVAEWRVRGQPREGQSTAPFITKAAAIAWAEQERRDLEKGGA
jgi:hypothetical protein